MPIYIYKMEETRGRVCEVECVELVQYVCQAGQLAKKVVDCKNT
jgi:hypothetical protein